MRTTRITAAVVAAMAFHYALSRMLASAASFAEAQEQRELCGKAPAAIDARRRAVGQCR